MPNGQTFREAAERKIRIAEFRWKILPFVTNEWQHISVFPGKLDSDLSKGIRAKWIQRALRRLEREGKVESMRDDNFPGTYWRLRQEPGSPRASEEAVRRLEA